MGEPPIAFLLPGQGSQYHRMAAGLYGTHPEFSAAMDAVFDLLGPDGAAVRRDWLADQPQVPIDHVTRSQILLFAVDHALAVQFSSWGLRPDALLGHSIGELAGAVLAGIFTLPEAVRLVWDRIQRLAAAPAGGMLAVAASTEQVAPYCSGDVVVGAVNAERQVILAGPRAELAEAAAALAAAGYISRPVPASTAFHSPMLAEAARGAVPGIAELAPKPPKIPLYSGYTTAPVRADQVTDPEFWACHPVAPVLFWPALQALLADGPWQLIEVGPGWGLTAVARRHPAVTGGRSRVLPALPARPSGDEADRLAVQAVRTALQPEAVR
ncbi:MAG TPA: acyltransferase domain-containing protein [Jatrophihabitans sp.]|nr:acyltransferase domain-containing protein [Jatrophihabitans sp.]